MAEFRRSPAMTLVIRIMVVIAATGLSIQPIPVAFGLDFIAGIILPFAFIRTRQPVWAIIAAVATAGPTLWLWGHPYFIVILTAEILFIVALMKFRINLLYSTLLYWLTLGPLIVFACYHIVLDTSLTSTVAVYAKQAINSIYAVLLVDFGYFVYVAVFARNRVNQNVFLSDSIQTAGLLIFTTFGLVAILVSSREREHAVIFNATANAQRAAVLLESDLNFHADRFVWLARRACALEPEGSIEGTELCIMRSVHSSESDGEYLARSPANIHEGETLRRLLDDEAKANPPTKIRDRSPLHYRPLSSNQQIHLVPVQQGRAMPEYAVPATSASALLRQLETSKGVDIHIVGRQPEGSFIQTAGEGLTARPATATRIPGREQLLENSKTLVSAWEKAQLLTIVNGPHSAYSIIVASPLAKSIEDYFQSVTKMLLATLAAIVMGTAVMYIWTLIIRNELSSLIYFAADKSSTGPNRIVASQKLLRSPLAEVRNLVSSFQSMMDELARQNDAINRLRQHYEKIISRAPGVLFTLRVLVDDAGQPRIGPCTYMSISIQEHFGYSVAEARMSHWWKASVHPDDWRKVEDEMGRLFDAGRTTLQYRFRKADGRYRWVYSELSVAYDDSIRPSEIIGFLSDHQDAHEAAQRFSQSERLASLGQMASGMAHELAQPLNIIGMTAQNVRMRLNGAAAEKEYLSSKINRIIEQVERAGKIIRNLRIFGKSANIPLLPISGLKVVNAVILSMEDHLGKQGIKLELRTPSEHILLLGDETMVEQILVNLINNARDAYDSAQIGVPKAIVRIELRYIVAERKGMIVVEDDAGGIDSGIMSNMFNPFVSSKPPGKGMGLGLALSKVMASDMGGDLVAENTPTGARFTLTLSLSEET